MPDAQVPLDTSHRFPVPDGGGAAPPDKAVDINQAVLACACAASSEHAMLLRATLQTIDACTARARIDEVLSPTSSELTSGDVVGGALPGFGYCGQGIRFAAGDEVLLVYTRGTQDGESCAEYAECVGKQCDAPEPARDGGDCFATCLADTRAACAAHADEARLGGQLVIAQYGNNLLFGYEPTDAAISLPKTEIDRLLDANACNEWFMQHGGIGEGGPSEAPSCAR